ncbi:MAG TPA: carboxypeptidase regulatory-like domain-containing protein [Gemmatimonadaceae bacterium]|nr:carboxypeptidase regulatory-like domain-containing protein [Gemmatimonadaceae bacterium]
MSKASLFPLSHPRFRRPVRVVRAHVVRLALASCVLALISIPALAQHDSTGTLTLHILAHESARPLEGAYILVAPSEHGITDTTGHVRITGIPPGKRLVVIRRLGYKSEHIRIAFAPGKTVDGDVELLVQPVQLAGVTVRGRGQRGWLRESGFYNRRQTGLGTFLTRDEILSRAHGAQALSDVLRGLPSVRLLPARGGSGYAVETTRGRCYAQVFVDGILIAGDQSTRIRTQQLTSTQKAPNGSDQSSSGTDASPGQRLTVEREIDGVNIDNLVPVSDIAGVEWFAGPAETPPRFNRTGDGTSAPECGTLVIWTRVTP